MDPFSHLYLGLRIQEPTSQAGLHHHSLQVLPVHSTQVYLTWAEDKILTQGSFSAHCQRGSLGWPWVFTDFHSSQSVLNAYFKLHGVLPASSLSAYDVEDTQTARTGATEKVPC